MADQMHAGDRANRIREIDEKTGICAKRAPCRRDIDRFKRGGDPFGAAAGDRSRFGIGGAGAYSPEFASWLFEYLYAATDMDGAIHRVLAALGQRCGVSRAYIFEDDPAGGRARNAFEWCAPGIEPRQANLRDVGCGRDLGGGCDAMFGEDDVCLCPDIAVMPPAIRDFFARQGVKGVAMRGIWEGGRRLGMIGFDDCTGGMVWTEELTGTLNLAAMMLGTFLTNWRRRDSDALFRDVLTALDDSASYIYIVDPDSYRVLYANRALRARFGDFAEGRTCYFDALGRDAPCEACPLALLAATGESRCAEVRRKDGVWMLSQANHIHWGGSIKAMITCTDISDRKLAESRIKAQNAEYAAIVRMSGKQIFRYDLASGTATAFGDGDVAGTGERTVRHMPEDLIRRGVVTPESAEPCRAFFARIASGEPTGECDLLILDRRGAKRWEHVCYTLISGAEGVPPYAVITYFDNTAARENELAYQKWLEGMARLLSEKAIYLDVNLTRDRVERSENMGALFERACEKRFSEFTSAGKARVADASDAPRFGEFFDRRRLIELFEAGTAEDRMRYRAMTPAGAKWYRVEVQMAIYPRSRDIRAFIVYTDIDEEMLERQELADSASVDAMTGLLNHAAMERGANEALSRARAGDRFALFMLDIDNFKAINDTLGHRQGDDLLAQVGESIRGLFRQSDLVSRFGGDEFMALMCAGATDEAVRERAKALLSALQFCVGDMVTTVSIGAVRAAGPGHTFEALYATADRALYAVKRGGKNNYHILDAEGDVRRARPETAPTDTVQLQTLLRCMSGGIIVCAVEGDGIRPTYVSPSLFEDLRQAGIRRVSPADMFRLVHPEDAAQVKRELLAAARQGAKIDLTFRVTGTDLIMRARGERQGPETEGRATLMVVISDVTAMKKGMADSGR